MAKADELVSTTALASTIPLESPLHSRLPRHGTRTRPGLSLSPRGARMAAVGSRDAALMADPTDADGSNEAASFSNASSTLQSAAPDSPPDCTSASAIASACSLQSDAASSSTCPSVRTDSSRVSDVDRCSRRLMRRPWASSAKSSRYTRPERMPVACSSFQPCLSAPSTL